MSEERQSMEESSRTGNGLVSRGDFVKVVFDDGDDVTVIRGDIVKIDDFFITVQMKNKDMISIAKGKIVKIVKYNRVAP